MDLFVMVHMDDVLVYSNNESEHLEHMKTVFGPLQEYKI